MSSPRRLDAAYKDPGQLIAFNSKFAHAIGFVEPRHDLQPDPSLTKLLQAYLHLVDEIPTRLGRAGLSVVGGHGGGSTHELIHGPRQRWIFRQITTVFVHGDGEGDEPVLEPFPDTRGSACRLRSHAGGLIPDTLETNPADARSTELLRAPAANADY